MALSFPFNTFGRKPTRACISYYTINLSFGAANEKTHNGGYLQELVKTQAGTDDGPARLDDDDGGITKGHWTRLFVRDVAEGVVSWLIAPFLSNVIFVVRFPLPLLPCPTHPSLCQIRLLYPLLTTPDGALFLVKAVVIPGDISSPRKPLRAGLSLLWINIGWVYQLYDVFYSFSSFPAYNKTGSSRTTSSQESFRSRAKWLHLLQKPPMP